MRMLLLAIALVGLTHSASAASVFKCAAKDSTESGVVLTVDGQKVVEYSTGLGIYEKNPEADKTLGDVSEYSFLVEYEYDTKTWIVVQIKNSSIVSAVEWVGGNDTDNYFGSPTDRAIVCK